MAQENNNDCSQKLTEQEKTNQKRLREINRVEEIVKVMKLTETPKVSKNIVKKAKGKYTLRADTQKRRTKLNTIENKSKQAMIPRIPRNVLRVIYCLRHKSFLKFVSKFFNPSPTKRITLIFDRKLTTYNTKRLNNKINIINNQTNTK